MSLSETSHFYQQICPSSIFILFSWSLQALKLGVVLASNILCSISSAPHTFPLRTVWVHTKSLQLCPTLCDPMDCSPPGSSVHGILQARILEWAAISSSKGIFLTQGLNAILMSPALAGKFFTTSVEVHQPMPQRDSLLPHLPTTVLHKDVSIIFCKHS